MNRLDHTAAPIAIHPSSCAIYLTGVAEIVGNGAVRRQGKPWSWRVIKNGSLPPVLELLEAKDKWLALITRTIEKFTSEKEREK